MNQALGNLDVPGFEQKPQGQAAGVVREVLADLGKRWALPPEEFALVLARELARAIEASPALLTELSATIAANLWRAIRGQALVEELARAGVTITPCGGSLRAAGKITPEAVKKIDRHRGELLAALQGTT